MKQQLDKQSREALIKYRIQRAKEILGESEQIIGLGFLNSAVNRLAYLYIFVCK